MTTMIDIAKRAKALAADRKANPKSVMDVNPDGAVTWSEVMGWIRDADLFTNAIDTRIAFQDAYNAVK